MNELIKEFKRHKIFFLTELVVFVLIAIVVGIKFDVFPYVFYVIFNNAEKVKNLEYWGMAYRIYTICDCFSITALYSAPPAVFICTFLRYVIFDNKKQRIFKSSVPLDYKTETLFEVLSGIVPIFVITMIYAVVCTLTFHWGGTYIEFAGFTPENIVYVFFNSAEYMFFYIVALYLFLVLAKRVSSSTGGIIIFFGLSLCLLTLTDGMVFLVINMAIPEPVISGMYIILSGILLAVFDRKLDISKGGTFYFKSISIAMTILSGVIFFIMSVGLFKNYTDKLTPPGIIFSVVVGIGVMIAEYYLTKPKINA